MSAQFDSGGNDYMTSDANGTPITDTPFSISAWVKADNLGIADAFVAGVAADADDWAAVAHSGSGENPQCHICAGGINDAVTDSTTNLADGAWHQVLAVFAADNSRELFVDGVSRGTDGSTRSPAAYVAIWLGRADSGALLGESNPYAGLLGQVAYYDTALGLSESQALFNGGTGGNGQNPEDVSAANLVAYYPLNTDFDTTDHVGTYNLTNSGAVFNADNPPVDPPSGGATGSGSLVGGKLIGGMLVRA